MATVTVTIPNTDWDVFLMTRIRWNPSSSGYINLGATLAAVHNTNLYFAFLTLASFNGMVDLYLSDGSSDHRLELGPEFSTQMEDHGTITLVASNGDSLVLTGISDSSEPYIWIPSNAAAVMTFAGTLTGLSDRSLTVTFYDGMDAPPVLTTPTFADDMGDAQSWTQDTTITSIVVPEATGNPPPTYAVVGSLPAGIGYHTGSRTIFGAPQAIGSGTITIRATNSEGSDDWTVTYTTGLPSWISGGAGSPTDPYIIADPLNVNDRSILDVMLPGRGTVSAATGRARATHFRFTPPAGYSGQWGVELDTTPTSVDMDLAEADGTPSSVTDAGDEDYSQTLTMGAPYTFLVLRYSSGANSQSSVTGVSALTITLSPPQPSVAPAFADDTGTAQSWTQSTAITSIAVPAASGTPTPTYAAVGSLPAGISFNTGTRVISGTPTATGSGTIRIRATNSGGTDDWTVAYTTTAATPSALAAVLTLTQTLTQNVYTWTNPGNDVLDLVCADETPIISSTTYFVVVTNIPSPQLTQSYDRPAARPYYALRKVSTDEFSNTVGPADNVDAGTPTVDITTSGAEVPSGTVINLAATASDPNNQTLTYLWTTTSLQSPEPPDLGLFTNATVRDAVWTAPVIAVGEVRVFLILTVTDPDGLTASDSVIFDVQPDGTPSFTDDMGAAQSWTQNTAITPITVPAATGSPTPAYAAVGSLPAGISFNTSSRVISGTPTATGNGTIRIRATNSEGTADWTVTYTTAAAPPADVAPSFTDDTGAAQSWTQNTAIMSFTVPEADGTPAPTYAAVGSLPAGIAFNIGTRVISGTPTAVGSGTITIRASNSEGSDDWTVTYTTTADVQPTAAPVFADDTGNAQSWTVGRAISSIRVPAASGNPTPTYAVVGSLPSGLAFSANTRRLTGTPTSTGNGTIRIRATNSEGTADWTVSYSTVAAPPTTWVNPYTWLVGNQASALATLMNGIRESLDYRKGKDGEVEIEDDLHAASLSTSTANAWRLTPMTIHERAAAFGQIPGFANNGIVIYNSSTNKVQGVRAGAWVDLGA